LARKSTSPLCGVSSPNSTSNVCASVCTGPRVWPRPQARRTLRRRRQRCRNAARAAHAAGSSSGALLPPARLPSESELSNKPEPPAWRCQPLRLPPSLPQKGFTVDAALPESARRPGGGARGPEGALLVARLWLAARHRSLPLRLPTRRILARGSLHARGRRRRCVARLTRCSKAPPTEPCWPSGASFSSPCQRHHSGASGLPTLTLTFSLVCCSSVDGCCSTGMTAVGNRKQIYNVRSSSLQHNSSRWTSRTNKYQLLHTLLRSIIMI
jgi:hypothetical protein